MAPVGGAGLLKADVPLPAVYNGTWWTPSEPGSGWFFEAQGSTGVVTFYTYTAEGRPVWYSASGAVTSEGTPATRTWRFTGTLQKFTGGQAATSSAPTAPTATPLWPIAIVFGSNGQATVQLPNRTLTAQRFFSSGGRQLNLRQPESGIYWNPAESGRGYTIEVKDNVAVIGVFHYAPDGQPTWHLMNVALLPNVAAKAAAPMVAYVGGSAFGAAFTAAPRPSGGEGNFALAFERACQGAVTFPGMQAVAVERFAFGGTAAACKTPDVGDLPPERGSADPALTDVQAEFESLFLARHGGAFMLRLDSLSYRGNSAADSPLGRADGAGGSSISGVSLLELARGESATPWVFAHQAVVKSGRLMFIPENPSTRYNYRDGMVYWSTLDASGNEAFNFRITRLERVPLQGNWKDAPAEFRRRHDYSFQPILDETVPFQQGATYYRMNLELLEDTLFVGEGSFGVHSDKATQPDPTTSLIPVSAQELAWLRSATALKEQVIEGLTCLVGSPPVLVCRVNGQYYFATYNTKGAITDFPSYVTLSDPTAYRDWLFRFNKAAIESLGLMIRGSGS